MEDRNREEGSLMPLLSEKHALMRKRCETLWNQEGAAPVSASEWYVLARIAGEKKSISEIARAADMTRQAAHKYVYGLQEKGLLDLEDGGGRRGKYAALSPYGERCMERYRLLQRDLEEQIRRSIGEDNIRALKALLRRDWFEQP